MSKMFVNRTDRVQFDDSKWLIRQINLLAIDNDSKLSGLRRQNVFDPTVKLPRTYTAIAHDIAGFKFGDALFSFDYEKVDEFFPEELLKGVDRTKVVPIGYRFNDRAKVLLVMDQRSEVWSYNHHDNKVEKTNLGSLHELLGIPDGAIPVPYAEIKLLGKKIPLGVLLGYQIGLGNLLKTSGVWYERYGRNIKRATPSHTFKVVFEDEILLFDRRDPKACLLFNGFNRLKNVIRRISVYSLDRKESYTRLLEALDAPVRHTRQYDLIFKVWVDHITRDELIEMGEPTDLVLLMLSAVDKLSDDAYSDPNGVTGSLIRGYQRVSGMVYTELLKALKVYHAQPMNKNAQIDVNPNAVWYALLQDQTTAPIEESNPIHSIKEKDIVVFRGQGGRGADTMTAKHRQFSKDSIGIISEANVDNGQVGTVTYLTANPNITSLRGASKPVEDLNADPSRLQSTAMLISAASDKDDESIFNTGVWFCIKTKSS